MLDIKFVRENPDVVKENVDKKLEAIEKREAGFVVKEEELKKQKIEISKLNEQRLQELERISGLTSEQAKEYLLKTIEEDVKLDTAKMILRGKK